jgi:hypothetical protein
MIIYLYKYRDKSKLECPRWNSPVVESCVVSVGGLCPPLTDEISDIWWAQPTLR